MRVELEEVKGRTSLVALIGQDVALKKRGGDHWGLCPFHTESTPSFKTSDRTGRFKCFGCGAGGDAIEYLRLAHGMTVPEAIDHLAVEAGMIPDSEGRKRPERKPVSRPDPQELSADEKGKREEARRIWQAAQPAPETLVDIYLQARGITIPVPPTIRYSAGLTYHPSGVHLPAMVAAVQAPDHRVAAIHRTYLRMDGTGKAGVRVPKMALGPFGMGAVRLGPAGPVLGLAEGIETGLSAMQLFGVPVWAALGSRLAQIALPPEVSEVHIFGDNGDPGRRAAEEAALTFAEQGRRAFTRFPPEHFGDFNDALRAEAAA